MATLYRQLKPRPGFSGERIAAHQRGRMHAAIIELVDRNGYDALTVAAIVEAAGVSKHTFYENFKDKNGCFLATYGLIVRHAARQVLIARSRADAPTAAVRAALLALAEDVAERPKEARFALVDGLDVPGEPKARWHATGLFALLITESLSELDASAALPSVLGRGIASGVGRIAHARLIEGREASLPDEAEGLAEWVLAFTGPLAAQVCSRQGTMRPPSPPSATERRASSAQPTIGDERAMILSAATRLAAEDGYDSLTVTRIRATAGISRRRFEDHFEGVRDCFLAALEQQTLSTLDEIKQAYIQAGSWAKGVHLAIVRTCDRLARDPTLVRLGFSEVLMPGAESLPWRTDFFSHLDSLLCAGAPVDQRPTALAAEASIGGLMSLLHHYSAAGQAQRLPAIADALSFLVLAPAIGADEAAAVISCD
jgi:AcrR family transcriptional regulator